MKNRRISVSLSTCFVAIFLSHFLLLQLTPGGHNPCHHNQEDIGAAAAANDNDGDPSRSLRAGVADNNKEDYQLALFHSYGFFDDIRNDDWILYYQKKARKAPHYRFDDDKNKRSDVAPHEWIFMNWDPYFTCPHIQKIGGLGGGPKWTCDVERILHTVQRRRRQQATAAVGTDVSATDDENKNKNRTYTDNNKNGCLVYSIGSKKNYKWEDGLYDILGNDCEYHIFDPGPYDRINENPKKNMYFHQWGLGSSYSKSWMQNMQNMYKDDIYLSFQEIRQKLGHEQRIIDLFKIDCEGCEWHSFRDWINADLRQIMIETHDLPSIEKEKRTDFGIFPKLEPSSFFDALQERGYVLFSKEVNTRNGRGRAVEWSFLKLHPSFLFD